MIMKTNALRTRGISFLQPKKTKPTVDPHIELLAQLTERIIQVQAEQKTTTRMFVDHAINQNAKQLLLLQRIELTLHDLKK
jgi:hypothetical protein